MSDTNTAINTVSVDCPAKTNLTLHVGRPQPCGRTPQVDYLLRLLRHGRGQSPHT